MQKFHSFFLTVTCQLSNTYANSAWGASTQVLLKVPLAVDASTPLTPLKVISSALESTHFISSTDIWVDELLLACISIDVNAPIMQYTDSGVPQQALVYHSRHRVWVQPVWWQAQPAQASICSSLWVWAKFKIFWQTLETTRFDLAPTPPAFSSQIQRTPSALMTKLSSANHSLESMRL